MKRSHQTSVPPRSHPNTPPQTLEIIEIYPKREGRPGRVINPLEDADGARHQLASAVSLAEVVLGPVELARLLTRLAEEVSTRVPTPARDPA
jgi:hypothetical protein